MAIAQSTGGKYNIYYSNCEISESNVIPEITLQRIFGQYRDIYNLCVDLWNTGDYTSCKIVNKFEVDLTNVISRDIEYRKFLIDEVFKMAIRKFFDDKSSGDEILHLTRKADKLILQFSSTSIKLTQSGYVGIQAPIMGNDYELPIICSDAIPEDFIKSAIDNLVSVILHEKDGQCELRAVCNNCI